MHNLLLEGSDECQRVQVHSYGNSPFRRLHPTKPPCVRVLKWHELTLPSSGYTGKKDAPLPRSFVLEAGFEVPTRGVPLARVRRNFYFVTERSAQIINFVRNGLNSCVINLLINMQCSNDDECITSSIQQCNVSK